MGMSPKTKADCDQQIANLQKQIAQRKAYIANVPDAGNKAAGRRDLARLQGELAELKALRKTLK
jgi:methylaspartate ammonia-lyase